MTETFYPSRKKKELGDFFSPGFISAGFSLVHIKEDITTPIPVTLHGSLLDFRYLEIIVSKPGLLLNVIYITNVMT